MDEDDLKISKYKISLDPNHDEDSYFCQLVQTVIKGLSWLDILSQLEKGRLRLTDLLDVDLETLAKFFPDNVFSKLATAELAFRELTQQSKKGRSITEDQVVVTLQERVLKEWNNRAYSYETLKDHD